MTSRQNDIPIPLDTATEQQQQLDVVQKQPQLPSKRIHGISSLTVGLVGAAIVLSGCAQMKPRPEHCRCNPSPPKQSSCDVTDKKTKEKFLKIALRLHKIHTEAMKLTRELDSFEQAGDENKETRIDAQKRKPKIKGRLMKLFLILRKYG